MIQLSVFANGVKTVSVASEPYFRISGGTIWTRPEARFVLRIRDSSWEFGRILWKGMRFMGPCRLIFGVPRAVEGFSTPFNGLTIERQTLFSQDIALASYDPAYDAWWSRSSEVRCHAFRIESVEVAQPTVSPTREFGACLPSRTARGSC